MTNPQDTYEIVKRKQLTQPIDKSSIEYQIFIRKKTFTIFEMAALMANIRPWVFRHDDIWVETEIEEQLLRPYLDVLREGLTFKDEFDEEIPF